MRRSLREHYDEAVRLLREHRHALDALAGALLERETLEAEQILAVTALRRAPESESAAPAVPLTTVNGG